MTSTMTTHAYVNETNPGENSFFRVPNDGIPDGARGIRFMLDYSTDEGKAKNRLFKKYFTIHNNNGKLSVKQVGLLDAEEMESFEVTVIASYRLNGQKHEISHRIVVNVVDVIQNNEIEYLEIGADAGTQLGVVKFAGKDATYTVKNAATNTVSTDFVVGSTGMLEVKQGASLSSQADYALIITTGEGASARSINVNVRVRAQSEVTGNFVAEEDITIFDPSGQIQLVDELVDDASSYQLSVNGAAVTGEDTRISATYGHLLVDADGDWHYVLDNTNTNVEALHGREGEDGHQLTETVTYSFTKGDQVITGSFTITINGRTDITYSAFDDLEAELYQHPFQIRKIASVLRDLSENGKIQTILTTHSPLLLQPDLPDTIKRITKKDSVSEVQIFNGSPSDWHPKKVPGDIYRLLNENVSEMLFADKVVLVEGKSDVAYIRTYWNQKRDAPFPLPIISLNGKQNTKPIKLARAFDIEVFVIFDADKNGNSTPELLSLLNSDVSMVTSNEILVRDTHFAWPKNIEEAIKNEMLDFDPSNINKEPILIAERLINAMQKGNVSTSMEKLLCQLEKFAS
ncbi:hypothetical protein IMCC14465_03580 [alpha proteobacterium IMCC14465]|uniref:OLD protein-like TOPRIM domain-containing protein n=1 Tax=alpha proteobacterium IMCC14465 TaxID=1220535 RepID=J9E251_9PROT|nr:hypothetical protein IMCC14465_03580 [alpha proteobacterium IMCC14465]